MSSVPIRYRTNPNNTQPPLVPSAPAGSSSGGEMDLQSLSQEEVDALMKQGITPEQIAMYAQQQGQPIPPVILAMMESSMPEQSMMMAPGMPDQSNQSMMGPGMPSGKKSKKSMMSLGEYASEKRSRKQKAKEQGAHEQTQYEYFEAMLEKEEQEREAKRTQGAFLIGVNLANLFNMFRQIIVAEEKGNKPAPIRLSSNQIRKMTGESLNVDFDSILDREMGFRGSDIPLLPEKVLDEDSSFQDVIEESRKYAESGFDDKITPFGLLIMTRMLYKYRRNNAQWLRVATILELIYKYLAGDKEPREKFFKNRDDIEMQALLELEEFYNTDHLFMTNDELAVFKKDLDFYKYDPKINVGMQIKELKNKPAPII